MESNATNSIHDYRHRNICTYILLSCLVTNSIKAIQTLF